MAAPDPETIVNLDPYLALIMESIQLITGWDPISALIDAIFGLFSGRPREQASLMIARHLAQSGNPAGRLLGVEIYRLVNDLNIVTSSSNPGDWQNYLEPIRLQFVQNLRNQGASYDRAVATLNYVWQRNYEDPQTPQPPLLQHAPDPKPALYGPQRVEALYQRHYQNLIAKGEDPLHAQRATERWLITSRDIGDLMKLRWCQAQGECLGIVKPGPPQPICPPGYKYDPSVCACVPLDGVGPNVQPSCPPGSFWDPSQCACVPSLVPPPPPQCPPGYHWDPQLERCVADNAPLPPPPSGPQDEFTICCNEWLAALEQLDQDVKNLTGGGNQPGPNADCCKNIVAAFGEITAQLTAIANDFTQYLALVSAGGGGGGSGGGIPQPLEVDFGPLLEGLTQLLDAASPLLGDAGAE